jgi:hypothetical protein
MRLKFYADSDSDGDCECDVSTLHEGVYTFSCSRCKISKGKRMYPDGACPRCHNRDSFKLISTSLDCYKCNETKTYYASE